MICTVALMRHGGSHLIRPIVSRLGFEIIEPGNFGAPLDEAQGPVIVFLREPRDRMVSAWRWSLNKPKRAATLQSIGATADEQIAWMLTQSKRGGFLPEMLAWARIWCRWEGALVVRFEDVRERGAVEVERIARHLEVTCDPRVIFDEVYGHGRTYTGSHSRWQDHFGPMCSEAWERNGGPELLGLMGYG